MGGIQQNPVAGPLCGRVAGISAIITTTIPVRGRANVGEDAVVAALLLDARILMLRLYPGDADEEEADDLMAAGLHLAVDHDDSENTEKVRERARRLGAAQGDWLPIISFISGVFSLIESGRERVLIDGF